ncbi:MAG: hypothetical protein E7158_04065 [Firmicutes bacterium]|nr:hypothetical protein [Bacillota bacterium]
MEIENNSNRGLKILVGLLLVVVLLMGGFILYDKVLNDKINSKDDSEVSEKYLEEETKNTENEGIKNPTKTVKVNSEEFEFEIPDNLVYYSNDQGLTIKDKDNTWSINIGQINESYASYTNNIFENFSDTFDVSNFKRGLYNNVEFTSVEVSTNSYSNTKYIVAYAKADNNYCFKIYVDDLVNNSFNYDVLSIIAPIIDSAVYVG